MMQAQEVRESGWWVWMAEHFQALKCCLLSSARKAVKVSVSLLPNRLFPGGSDGKQSASNAGDLGSAPGSGRSPGERNGYLIQYSCLENPGTEEPGGPQSMGSQRVGQDWVTNTFNRLWWTKSYSTEWRAEEGFSLLPQRPVPWEVTSKHRSTWVSMSTPQLDGKPLARKTVFTDF